MRDVFTLRERADHRGAGRLCRLERAVLGIHSFIAVVFAGFAVAPLVRNGDVAPGELAVRLCLALILLSIAIDLRRNGERLRQVGALAAGVVLADVLDFWPAPGDITAALAFTVLAISAGRLFYFGGFLVALALGSVLFVAPRLVIDSAVPTMMIIDSAVLTGAMTISIAFFIGSLEDRAKEAGRLDEQLLAGARKLTDEEARRRVLEDASRVLHDDVLTALRLIADSGPLDDGVVRRGSGAAVDSIRRTWP